jgi:hypothetical protein
MIHIPCVQGSEEWHRLRLGRPTASEFDRIITPKKWEPTTGAARRGYALKLLTELILDISLDQFVTPAMLHGKDWEPKARAAYEYQHGVDVEPVGFCTNDEGTAGASPDAFVGGAGSLEIKCPELPQNHVGYLLSPETLVAEHWVQVQGQLYITGREWTDLISYFHGMPMVCRRILPQAEFQVKLDAALKQFVQDLANLVDLAKARGVEFPKPDEEVSKVYSDWITEEDAEAILAGLGKQEPHNG